LGTRLQDFRGNKSTKILLDVKGTSMINRQISQLYKWGMRKFVIITNPEYLDMVKEDTLNKFDNLKIDFTVQEEPKGISHALYQARDYVDQNEKIFFVLGDNFFENNPFKNFHLDKFEEGACIFTTEVNNPEEFGVAEIDSDGNVLSIEEKPNHPKSNSAVVGIYMFDHSVFQKIETLEPSARGEYEVTDLCNIYVNENKCLNLDLKGWWIDAGTPDRIIELEEKLS
jgi:glucose-1-phosphate thymidylyltransferase